MTNLDHILAVNRDEIVSEADSFTRRYQQFVRHFRPIARVLDIVSNSGRAVTKARRPGLRLTGADCVPERVAILDPLIYGAKISGLAMLCPRGRQF